VARACRFGRPREQQADGALPDDADMPAVERGQLLDGVEHTGQRLQADGLRGGERRIVRRHLVAVGHHTLHQPVERGCPTHHPITGPVLGVAAGDDLPDNLMDREAIFFGAAASVVTRKWAAHTAKCRHVAAADPGGHEPQQHLAIAEALGCLLGDRRLLELIRRDDPVGPHVRPPPAGCSSPIESSTAAGMRTLR
jgi:hypothetical protein